MPRSAQRCPNFSVGAARLGFGFGTFAGKLDRAWNGHRDIYVDKFVHSSAGRCLRRIQRAANTNQR